MKLLLVRHGNTFEADQVPTWVGSAENPQLTAAGRDQAAAVGAALRRTGTLPQVIYSGSLARLTETARIVAGENSEIQLRTDPRLNEIDYGSWSGKSDAEIRELGFGDALSGWTERSVWPSGCGWPGSESQVRREIVSLVADLTQAHQSECVLVVSSNGRLRYFLSLVNGAYDRAIADRTFKVGTGKLGAISFDGTSPTLLFWNRDPNTL